MVILGSEKDGVFGTGMIQWDVHHRVSDFWFRQMCDNEKALNCQAVATGRTRVFCKSRKCAIVFTFSI